MGKKGQRQKTNLTLGIIIKITLRFSSFTYFPRIEFHVIYNSLIK